MMSKKPVVSRAVRLHAIMATRDLSCVDLARLSGLADTTVYRILYNDEFLVQQTTAEAIADALGLKINQIFDSGEVSNIGRPALTGSPFYTRSVPMKFCPTCGLARNPNQEECAICG